MLTGPLRPGMGVVAQPARKPTNINPATKYVALSASNRTRIKARLAGNGKPLSKAATPIRVLFEAPNKLIIK
ncbi:hypothetical protein [Thiolapillus sp.]|uniref:hypothetical protein n=1 Tax=Thiolapillus sp. TaxID=2017437 RepID=UPI0025F72A2E|nr:hypothetical protein [Thiolapillus sp.]